MLPSMVPFEPSEGDSVKQKVKATRWVFHSVITVTVYVSFQYC